MHLLCSFLLLFWLAGSADAAPAFHVERREGGWQLVAPDGKPFFSRGVCCVTMGASREAYVDAKPGYAAWQQYDDRKSLAPPRTRWTSSPRT